RTARRWRFRSRRRTTPTSSRSTPRRRLLIPYFEHGSRPRSRCARGRRHAAARYCARARRVLPRGRGGRRDRRRLARAALRCGAHAGRRRCARAVTVGGTARAPPGRRKDDVRLPPRRDPLCAGERDHAARAWRPDRGRGRAAPRPAADAPVVVVTALAGAVVNLLALWQVGRANRESLNVEGSFRHLMTDFFAFVATVVAGTVVWTTGFQRADPLASLAVSASMLVAAGPLLRAT